MSVCSDCLPFLDSCKSWFHLPLSPCKHSAYCVVILCIKFTARIILYWCCIVSVCLQINLIWFDLIWFDYLKLIRRPAIYLIIYDHGDVVMFYLSIFCYRFCYHTELLMLLIACMFCTKHIDHTGLLHYVAYTLAFKQNTTFTINYIPPSKARKRHQFPRNPF